MLITGCEDKLIPFKTDDNTGRAEDEEVRLFYVGLTRAKRKLFLCRAFKRQRFGRTDYCDPSPFLDVIRGALVGGGAGKAAAREQPRPTPPRAAEKIDSPRISRRRARASRWVTRPRSRRGTAAAAVVGRGGYGYGNGYARKGRTSANDRRGSPSDRSGGGGWRRSTQRRRRGARRGEHRRRRKRRGGGEGGGEAKDYGGRGRGCRARRRERRGRSTRGRFELSAPE